MLAHRPYRLYLDYSCAIFVVKRQRICKQHSWDNRAGLHSLQQHNDPHTFTQQVLTCFESFLLFFAYSITLREPFMCIPSSNSENVNFWGYIYKFWRPWSVQDRIMTAVNLQVNSLVTLCGLLMYQPLLHSGCCKIDLVGHKMNNKLKEKRENVVSNPFCLPDNCTYVDV